MALVNEHYLKLENNYLFADIAKRVARFRERYPDADLVRLGIGDVTRPLAEPVVEALRTAASEMAHPATFRGYGPEQGYGFLVEKILQQDYRDQGVNLSADEIFISDGTKSDIGNIGDILGVDNTVAVTDPVYPVYVDTNVMGGRAGELTANGCWSCLVYLPCTAENNFVPELPAKKVDVIYLCFPNNPTGTTLKRGQLKRWVDYARTNESLILFDAAYEAYISQKNVPHSIYEIEGAREVAIEFRSFSKTAGFTGTRCGFTVVPKSVFGRTRLGTKVSLNGLWNRRHTTKFNGTSYVVQRAAEAVYSPEGAKAVRETIDYYMRNASAMRSVLADSGFQVFGGVDAPYLWVKIPQGFDSWGFFDFLLKKLHIVSTPGCGFGPSGEGYLRLTAFGSHTDTAKALDRIKHFAW